MKVAIQRLRFPRFRHDSLIYRAKHRQVAQNAWAVWHFRRADRQRFCEGREPKGASLAVHSVSKLKYRHSPGQEAETHATYLICFHGSWGILLPRDLPRKNPHV